MHHFEGGHEGDGEDIQCPHVLPVDARDGKVRVQGNGSIRTDEILILYSQICFALEELFQGSDSGCVRVCVCVCVCVCV